MKCVFIDLLDLMQVKSMMPERIRHKNVFILSICIHNIHQIHGRQDNI